MAILNQICSYWYECIQREDLATQDILIKDSSKAVLCSFSSDQLMFQREDIRIPLDEEHKNIQAFFERTKRSDTKEAPSFYYGYPVLYYKYQNTGKNPEKMVPLLMMKVRFEQENQRLFLCKDEAYPQLSANAAEQLGIEDKEVAEVNQQIEEIYMSEMRLSGQKLANKIFKLINECASLDSYKREKLDVNNINTHQMDLRSMAATIYNRSLIFTQDDTQYNKHLLDDLFRMKTKKDLHRTALSLLSNEDQKTESGSVPPPILPFPANPYQIEIVQKVRQQALSVITGPPGTGKSQLIANIIINLFVNKKSVLLVSHTGDAVDVVMTKINDEFNNLLMRTGNKTERQELRDKFNQLTENAEENVRQEITLDDIQQRWNLISQYCAEIEKRDKCEQEMKKLFKLLHERLELLGIKKFSLGSIWLFLGNILIRLKLKISAREIRGFREIAELEGKIREVEKNYFEDCHKLVKGIYLKEIMGDEKNVKSVNALIKGIERQKIDEINSESNIIRNSLKSLRVWGTTLKSLRANFSLEAGIFDYVIFDEASQVDMASAAPALYRSKSAIVVGDPMQLSHISSLTQRADIRIAKKHQLDKQPNLYPRRVRHSNVSLFDSAAESSAGMLLTNHYRSADQIISLCNQIFYGGKLKIRSVLDYAKFGKDIEYGVKWQDIKGTSIRPPQGSLINQQEAKEITKIVLDLINKYQDVEMSIGIVSPYAAQVTEITKEIKKVVSEEVMKKFNIQTMTAHKYQGSERDIMIFSQVVSVQTKSQGDDRWYNLNPQVINVALSRARYVLYIVGDKEYCATRPESSVLRKIVDEYDKLKKQEKLEEYSRNARFDSISERVFYKAIADINWADYGYELRPKLVVKRYTLDFALIHKGKDVEGNVEKIAAQDKIDAIYTKTNNIGYSANIEQSKYVSEEDELEESKSRKNIALEIDGTQHEIIQGVPVLEDMERDSFLRNLGWEVMRFPNHQVLQDIENVKTRILNQIKILE